MNPEILGKCGLAALAIASYTIISVSEKGNGMKLGPDGAFALGRKIDSGNKEILSEIRDLKSDVDKRMDDLAGSVTVSDSKTSKEWKYLRGLATQTHIVVELMKKNNVTADDRAKNMNEMIAAGKAGPDLSDDE